MDEYTEWEKWFERWGDYGVHAAYYERNTDFTVEDLYQMFKSRLEAERAAHSANPQQPTGD
jgi:hypothetical protein